MTSTDYFHRMGSYLIEKMARQNGAQDNDLPFLRQWLDDAPTHALPGTYGLWGRVLSHLIERMDQQYDLMPGEPDELRLGAYFAAMNQLSDEGWWQDGVQETRQNIDGEDVEYMTKPVYESFSHVCSMLVTQRMAQGHLFLHALMASGTWEPTPLLLRLEGMRAQQEAYNASQGARNRDVRDLAQGWYLKALRPLLLDTTWRPQDIDAYGDMWMVHDNARGSNNLVEEQRARTFIRTLSKSTPSQTHKALRALQAYRVQDVDNKCVDDFFPLRLAQCEARPTLDALIGLLTEKKRSSTEMTERADATERKLRYHHPEVLAMLHTHLTLFPEANAKQTFVDALVPGFQALLGQANDSIALPDNALEEDSHSAW